jgi:hypothetical protein
VSGGSSGGRDGADERDGGDESDGADKRDGADERDGTDESEDGRGIVANVSINLNFTCLLVNILLNRSEMCTFRESTS